jgi:hypothetical protein
MPQRKPPIHYPAEHRLPLNCRGQQHFKNQLMNKIFPVTLLVLMSIGNIATPAIAKPDRSSCDSTLRSIKKSLTGVVIFKQRNMSNEGQPRGRSQALDITFKDDGNVPNNKNRMAIATRIINSCSKIASVSFGIDQTDDGSIYGIKKGQIIKFACIDPGIDKKLNWGETYCP